MFAAYWIYVLLGLGVLYPWNAFLTSLDYYFTVYPDRNIDRMYSAEPHTLFITSSSNTQVYHRLLPVQPAAPHHVHPAAQAHVPEGPNLRGLCYAGAGCRHAGHHQLCHFARVAVRHHPHLCAGTRRCRVRRHGRWARPGCCLCRFVSAATTVHPSRKRRHSNGGRPHLCTTLHYQTYALSVLVPWRASTNMHSLYTVATGDTPDGLRNGAMAFYVIAVGICAAAIALYLALLHRLPIVRFYRDKVGIVGRQCWLWLTMLVMLDKVGYA